jgi:GT2 family glycosyltransferase
MDNVTVVITSTNRLDLLERTIKSFKKYNTYPIEKYIIIDDSTQVTAEQIDRLLPDSHIIINPTNIGQSASIDKAYSYVTTDFIFHCEDDWEFFDESFIEKSIDVLNERPDIYNINIRIMNDGEKGSSHPVSKTAQKTVNGTIYYEWEQEYIKMWHGFSWNPGLVKLSNYIKMQPYVQYLNEKGINKRYKELGFLAASLEKPYCRHIGKNRHVHNKDLGKNQW